MANAWIPLPGYKTSVANKELWRGDHVGPALYATGGEIIVPSAFGFQAIEDVGAGFGGFSYSNNYYVKTVLPANSASVNENQAPTFGQNASTANNTNAPQMVWYYANNNNQVAANTNLAAELVRIAAWGA